MFEFLNKRNEEANQDSLELAKGETVDMTDSDTEFDHEVRRVLNNMDLDEDVIEKYLELNKDDVNYIENGKVNVDKLEKNLNSFMFKSFLIWYRQKEKDLLNTVNLSIDKDPDNFGEYSISPDRSGTAYIENKEVPTIAYIEKMADFIGKSHAEVREAVIKRYGSTCRIPDLEDEMYILSLSKDRVSDKMKEEVYYYFMGSTFYNRDNYINIPCLDNYSGNFLPSSSNENDRWDEDDRVVLLTK